MNPNSTQKRIAFGYERASDNTIVIHEGQAAAVKLLYQYYSEGKSLSDIKSTFEGLDVPSPQNGKAWSKQTLSNILSNPHYLGSEKYPPLISQELYQAVQDIKASREKQFRGK